MPLFYSVVARGMVVLAKHANYQGNFGEILEGVLIQIGPENKKQSLLHDRYLYHYICEDQIVYMCITDDVSLNINYFGTITLYKYKLNHCAII